MRDVRNIRIQEDAFVFTRLNTDRITKPEHETKTGAEFPAPVLPA